jgi:hypothetical protein
MSLGLYIVANQELQELTKDIDFKSLEELLEERFSKKELNDFLAKMGIDRKEINPKEKIFYLDNTQDTMAFQIFKTLDSPTIHQYVKGTKANYCYEIIIEDLTHFYSEFMEYLKAYDFPFEIWRIREDSYEPEDIKRLNFTTISEQNLKMIFADDGYIQPILARFYS